MTYLWPSGDPIIRVRCNGTTQRGRRCKVRALGFPSERETYYCGHHLDQQPPVPGRIVGSVKEAGHG